VYSTNKNRSLRKKVFSELQLDKSLSDLSRELGIKIKNLSRYKDGTRTMTLELFLKILEKTSIRTEDLQKQIRLKLDKNGVFVPIGPIVTIDKNWVYVAELIRGDGNIPKNLWNITFVNKENLLINYVENFFKNLDINTNCISVYKRKDISFLVIRSKLLAYLFSKIFNISTGKKYEMMLPDFIENSKEFISAAIRGFFDAEGTVANGYGKFKSPRRVVMSSISKQYVNSIQRILLKLSIGSIISKEIGKRKKPVYRLFIYHQNNLKKFYEVISPLHPKRRKKLFDVIKSYNKNRIPEGVLAKNILFALKQLGGKATRKEISNKLNINPRKLGWHLSWLYKNNFLNFKEKRVKGNKIYIYYLTNKDRTL
jgi:DNA-binding transcriptional ArsR family regulator